MTHHIPPFIGVSVPTGYTFAVRVMWYAIWVKAHPFSSIHFKFDDHPTKSFIIETGDIL